MATNVFDNPNRDLLRFITAGSVDDGKSTLIGRLLFDSQSLFDDQIEAVRSGVDGEIDFARLTDGLRAEREQGITIDVAYRYFSTAKRRFIVADTPGHLQYTRNMFTAASNTNLAIVLVDGSKGITEQTRRHTYLASLLGIPHLVLCINKMDLVDYSQRAFEETREQSLQFVKDLKFQTLEFIPVSALKGDNLVAAGHNMPWYQGPPLLGYVEEIDVDSAQASAARFPVQYVINAGKRDQQDSHFRGYAGQIYSGKFSVGDSIVVLPSGKRTRIKSIHTVDGLLGSASAPLSVSMLFEDDLDIGRGDMITHEASQPNVESSVNALVCWMDETPLKKGRIYRVKQSARYTRLKVNHVRASLDINTLSYSDSPSQSIEINEIGSVSFDAASPLVYDAYDENRLTGSFIIIDEATNATAGAGLILDHFASANVRDLSPLRG